MYTSCNFQIKSTNNDTAGRMWNPSINICGTAPCYHQLMDNADTSHFIVMTARSIAK